MSELALPRCLPSGSRHLVSSTVLTAGAEGKHSENKWRQLHYYDNLPMSAMLQETMHNVDRETELLQSLVRQGAITDLTGGIHCSFC